ARSRIRVYQHSAHGCRARYRPLQRRDERAPGFDYFWVGATAARPISALARSAIGERIEGSNSERAQSAATRRGQSALASAPRPSDTRLAPCDATISTARSG